jgi:hypothetical protein
MVAVNTAIKAILRKVGARNRTQAALWALENLPDKGTPGLQPVNAVSGRI